MPLPPIPTSPRMVAPSASDSTRCARSSTAASDTARKVQRLGGSDHRLAALVGMDETAGRRHQEDARGKAVDRLPEGGSLELVEVDRAADEQGPAEMRDEQPHPPDLAFGGDAGVAMADAGDERDAGGGLVEGALDAVDDPERRGPFAMELGFEIGLVVRVARRPEHVAGARAEGAGIEGVLVEVTGEVLLPVLLLVAPLDQEAQLAPEQIRGAERAVAAVKESAGLSDGLGHRPGSRAAS